MTAVKLTRDDAARGADLLASRERLLGLADRLRTEVATRIVGQEQVLEEVLMAMLAGGHALLVGAPGLAKTLLVRTVAAATGLEFRRIQFTPDLVPSDVTGSELLEEDPETGARRFRFVKGPIFANVVLADELNRAPPRTQAALLEAMQEHSVTAGGETRPLPAPFCVLATQNPIEQEGTYPLPEAQLDRFLFEVRVGYPTARDEMAILRSTTGEERASPAPVLGVEELKMLQRLVRHVAAADAAIEYASTLARATRPQGDEAPALVRRHVRWGAGPRAGQALVLGAKAHALLGGRLAVSPDDIRRVAHVVLRHRVLPTFAAEAEGVGPEKIVDAVLEHVAPPRSGIGR